MTITELYKIIVNRKKSEDTASYTASLFTSGTDRIIQKVGEESVEVVIAAKNDDRDEFVGEVADLYYHLLVLLVAKDISFEEIEMKLEERHTKKTGSKENNT